MLEFKSVSPVDAKRYNRYRENDKTFSSEGAFATMFMWNGYYNMEYAENGEFLFIRFMLKNKTPAYYFPIGKGNLKNAIDELLAYTKDKGEKLRFILATKENADRLEELFAEKFEIQPDRNTFDYVYLTEKMISLSGKKLHQKRNHFNFFMENYEFKYIKVTESQILEKCAKKAYEIINAKTKNQNSFELGAMEKYFEHYFELNQTGCALEIDGEIIAMSFGEKMNDDMALIQIELADDNYRGAYQAVNKLFCENEWKDCLYVNREEDMGIEGLRKAKKSYQPEFLVEKFVITEV